MVTLADLPSPLLFVAPKFSRGWTVVLWSKWAAQKLNVESLSNENFMQHLSCRRAGVNCGRGREYQALSWHASLVFDEAGSRFAVRPFVVDSVARRPESARC